MPFKLGVYIPTKDNRIKMFNSRKAAAEEKFPLSSRRLKRDRIFLWWNMFEWRRWWLSRWLFQFKQITIQPNLQLTKLDELIVFPWHIVAILPPKSITLVNIQWKSLQEVNPR